MIGSRSLYGFVAILASWNSISHAVTIPTVPVGNPGNAGDTVVNRDGTTGYGAVPYSFYIDKYDVTNSQYAEFLNTKDPAGANALGLWNSNMADATYGGISFNAAAVNGNKYSLIIGRQNYPVNYVNFFDTVRFANWLNNGQGNSDTESGAYTLVGGIPIPHNGERIARNPGARVFLPSENEWYKAAYYNPSTSSYFLYPTSNTNPNPPIASSPTNLPNHANFDNAVGNLTEVGAYTGTTSPYGAFDMGGNVEQWNEALYLPGGQHLRGARGGSFLVSIDGGDGQGGELISADRDFEGAASESSYLGFRVASTTAIVAGPVGAWIGGTDTSWVTASNWFGMPGATAGTTNTDTATFNRYAPNSPLVIDAGRNLKNVTFDTANVNVTTIGTTGGNTLLLTAGGTIQTTTTVVNPQSVNCPLVLEGDYTFTSGATISSATLSFGGRITPGASSGVTTLTLNGANAGANTINGVLADNGAGHLAVTIAGPGDWILSGANTHSGSTTITAGKLILQNSAALRMSTLSLSIDNGLAFASGLGSSTLGGLAGSGKLALQDQASSPAAVNVTIGGNGTSTTYGGILSGAGSLNKVGAGTLALANNNTYTGGTTITAGALQLGDGVSTNGSVPGNVTDNAALVFANPNSQTFSGVISGAGSVSKTAVGTLTLSGNNNFTGGLSIQQGTLLIATINNAGAVGPLGASPSVSLGSTGQTGVLECSGGTSSTNMTFALVGGGNGILQIDAAGTNLSLGGVISGSGIVTKSGAGTLILGANNSFTGGVTINAGMIRLSNSGALNSGTPNPVRFGPGSSGVLDLGGSGNIIISSLQSNSLPGAPIVENANASTGQVSTLTVNDSGTDTFAGVMRDDPAGHGVLAIAKSGGGTLVLTGANTYTGDTTINGGNLQLGDGAMSNGSIAGNIGDNSGLIFANPNPQMYSGILVGTGSVTKSAAGTLTLGGNNSFSGGLTVQQGTLVINTINYAHSVGSLGANANVTLASSGQTATLEYAGSSASSDMPFTLTTGGNSAFQIDAAAATLTLSGILSGGGNLIKSGPGTVILAGNNSYTGSTTVSNGTLMTTTGTVGGGSLAVNGSSGGVSAVSFGRSQSIASLSGTVSGGGSARVNVAAGTTLTVNQPASTIFAGTIALAPGAMAGTGGALAKSNGGTLEIDGGLALGNNSSLAVSGGRLRLNVASGSPSVGSGVTAKVTGSAILELAASVSALGTTTTASRVAITNSSNASAGLLVSAGNQQVGGIGGTGGTQVLAGASLTADHIIQGALIIGGTAGSHGLVTIDASDASGNPLNQPSGFALAGSLTPSDSFGAGGISSAPFHNGGGDPAPLSPADSTVGGNTSTVPEPATILLMLFALSGVIARRITQRRLRGDQRSAL